MLMLCIHAYNTYICKVKLEKAKIEREMKALSVKAEADNKQQTMDADYRMLMAKVLTVNSINIFVSI